MNWVTMGIGIAAILYGVFTLFLRFTAPEKFGKLEAMKERLGEKAGLAFHFFSYTVIPIAVGVSLVIAGIKGATLFGR